MRGLALILFVVSLEFEARGSNLDWVLWTRCKNHAHLASTSNVLADTVQCAICLSCHVVRLGRMVMVRLLISSTAVSALPGSYH